MLIYDVGGRENLVIENTKSKILDKSPHERRHEKDVYVGKKQWSGLIGRADIAKLIEAVGGKLAVTLEDHNSRSVAVVELENSHYYELTVQPQYLWVEYMGTKEEWNEIEEKISKFIDPILDKETKDKLNISFIFQGKRGMSAHEQRIVCPTWEEIQGNYTHGEKIQTLINLKKPDEHGKLVFWHGKPGTGKTFCIRALMQEWRSRAEMIYIMDPEDFFGSPGYMFEALMMKKDDYHYHGVDEEDKEEDDGIPKSKFKFLIIEDALDLILADNRSKMSAPMSRLLNLTEGIVGQGFRMVVLVTTNEDITNVDKAFMRPGRCIQSLEFPEFEPNDCDAWLKGHGLENTKTAMPQTLAELYQTVHEKQLVVEGKSQGPIGFTR